MYFLDNITTSPILHQVNSGIQERNRLRKELWNNHNILKASGVSVLETKNHGNKKKKSVRGQTKDSNHRLKELKKFIV